MNLLEKDTDLFMQSIGQTLEEILNPDKKNRKWGYMVMVFPFGEGGVANYISNARREDMIKTLREKADVLEKKLDIVANSEQ